MLAVGTWGLAVEWPGTDFPGTLAEGRSGALREGTSFQKQQRPWTSVPQPVLHTLVRPLLLPELRGNGPVSGAKGRAVFIQT